MRVNLSDWITKPELKPEESQSNLKVTFFDTSFKNVPEFVASNQYVTLKESERNLLLEHLAKYEEEQK